MGLIGNKEDQSPKLNVEKAREIIISWMKERKFKESKIDLMDEMITEMAEDMISGQFVLGDDNLFTYKFTYPLKNVDDEAYLTSVKLKDRIDYQRGVKPHMAKVKTQDTAGMMMAYACGLSGLHMNELQKLDTRDMAVLRNYALLFF